MTVSASAAPAASSPAEISRPPEVASSSALTCAPGETSADAAWSGLNKSCLRNRVLEDRFNRYEGNGTCSTSGLDKQSVGSGGLGFRYELASKFGMHTGIDVAHSPGTTALYLVVGNAWFRP